MDVANEPGNRTAELDGTAPPGEGTRDVSLDEAVAIAIFCLKNRRTDDAEQAFRAILEAVPDHPAALHFAGVLAHEQQRYEEAVELMARSLRADPSQADWHSNLGIALKSLGRTEEAAAAYRRAIALDPAHAKAHNNLGVLHKTQGLAVEAEASYREAIRINPEYAEAYYNLAALLWDQGLVPEALAEFNRAAVLSPATPDTRPLRARAHCALGKPEEAVRVYDDWLREQPDDPVAVHLRAACSGQAVPARAADSYVETTFDGIAADFEAHLAYLEYRAPQAVASALASVGVPASGGLDVLDAGCGTGLCGPLLRPYARRLAGVDLSGLMLAKAEEKNVYDDLCRAELTDYLAARPASFDVVASADTLVYFGALHGLAAAAATALRPGGWLIFTVEAADDGDVSPGYVLRHSGRYAHVRAYLQDVFQRAGFRPEIAEANLRHEGGLPVRGFVVRASWRADAASLSA